MASLKIERLMELGIQTLVCGTITEPLQHELSVRGVKIIGFVAGEIDEVVKFLLDGTLPTRALSMPGCCGRRNRFRDGRRRGGCGRWRAMSMGRGFGCGGGQGKGRGMGRGGGAGGGRGRGMGQGRGCDPSAGIGPGRQPVAASAETAAPRDTEGTRPVSLQSGHPMIAVVDAALCTGCEICIEACADKAISVNGSATVDLAKLRLKPSR